MKPEKLFEEAKLLHQKSQLAEAAKLYKRVIKLNPQHFDALRLLGHLYIHIKDFQQAIDCMQKALILNPSHAQTHYNLGIAQQESTQIEAAIHSYNRAIAYKPNFIEAYLNRGNMQQKLALYTAAIASYDKAIEFKPDFMLAYFLKGMALEANKQFGEALKQYEKAIALNPNFTDAKVQRDNLLNLLQNLNAKVEAHTDDDASANAHFNQAVLQQDAQQYELALQNYALAIALKPDFSEAHFNCGYIYQLLNQPEAALKSYELAILHNPHDPEAYFNRGITFEALNEINAALASYQQAIAIKPDFAEAHFNLGYMHEVLKNYDAALLSYEQALSLKPDFAEAALNCGNVLMALKQPDSAILSYDKAIQIKPDYALAYVNRGNVYKDLKQYEPAIANYEQAIAIQPEFAEAHYNLGIVLQDSNDDEAALKSYNQALVLNPNFAEAYNNRGVVLKHMRQYDLALQSLNQAIALNPNDAEAYSNRGVAYKEIKQYKTALADFSKALELDPQYDFLYDMWVYTKITICDWQDIEQITQTLIQKIESGEKAVAPFQALALLDSPRLQMQASKIFCDAKYPQLADLAANTKKTSTNKKEHKKIRIGYFSSDFHHHATAYLMAGLFEAHDKNKFEIIAYSFDPDPDDAMRQRLVKAFDRFIDVRNMSDQKVAELAIKHNIDIAIDLKGYTDDARTAIFSYRVAPIQINYIGYPGTIHADYMDYIIADPTLIPEESQQFYAEKIIYLPNSYQVNDRKREIADKQFSREALGLPAQAFVYCCFNNNFKITPAVFSSWMRILAKVPDSVLWLLEDNPDASENLKKAAEERSIAANRLIFAKRMPLAEHLARHRYADLFLDTLPYNAHTTTSDALWAGLPVLTMMGESFVGRVAASLLKAIELPELITSTQTEYENVAIDFAKNPEKLAAIKTKLMNNRLSTPLFDTALYTQHLEQAYQQIYARQQAGQKPEHLYIQA